MKEKCEIIRDLLPLVQDGVASEASCRLVREHLETCEECRSAYSLDPVKMPDETLDRRLIASVRKAFFLMGIVLLLIGTLVGVLTMTVCSFFVNNFLVYPAYLLIMPEQAIIDMYSALVPCADEIWKGIVVFNMPLTFFKGLADAALTFILYKHLSPLLKGKK